MKFNADLQTCQDSRGSIRSKHGEWKLPIPLVYTSLLVVIVFKGSMSCILLNTLFNFFHYNGTWFYDTNAFTYQQLFHSRHRPTSVQKLYSSYE